MDPMHTVGERYLTTKEAGKAIAAGAMGSRILIACGDRRLRLSPFPPTAGPELAEVVEKVAELFTSKMGYTRVLREISKNPTSGTLVNELDDWLSTDRER